MSEEKDNARDPAVEAFLKSVMGSAPAPAEPDAEAGTEPVSAEEAGPQAGASTRATVPKGVSGARKITLSAGSQTVARKPVPAPVQGVRPEAQKTPQPGMKSGTFTTHSGPVPMPAGPVHATRVVLDKGRSPIPMLNLIVNVVLLLLFMVLLAMLANFKSALVRQDVAIGKLYEAIEKVQTTSRLKFGVVQDPKRGLLGVFVDTDNPSSYKVVDLKEEQ